jgi:NitT/TauT family transport system ATP-binding protein
VCAAKLETIDLGKSFYQARLDRYTPVLDHLNLAVASGEFVSLVGPSGCGKTTLLNLLDGLTLPTEGQVLVAGAPVVGPGPDRALVFQEPALLPWRTVLGNIAYGLECLKTDRRQTTMRAQAWLQAVGLEGFGTHYPHELSGGMQQRVNLARALAVDPEILLMDEPFAALDAQTREMMQGELLSVWERTAKTVVFVTHQISEALYLADRVVVLSARPGRIREVIPVELPRPRDDSLRSTRWFQESEGYIRALLRADAQPA